MSDSSQTRLLDEGTTLGRYELRRRLAKGGMAEVWLAKAGGAEGFAKTVVLKTILPELAADPKFVEMFIKEARLAATLNHPNIVQIFDLGRIEDCYYIAMEHVTGRTLRQLKLSLLCQRKVPPPWLVFRSALAVCNALEHAHGARDESGRPLGIVHRDVTPENVMISFAGVTKVFDFGIAKVADLRDGDQSRLIGKHAYLSPEQIETSGRMSDARSDIYSLGVTLYELLTGVRPFRASSEKELLGKILTEPAKPPSKLASWVSPSMDDLVMRAIDKDPDRRHQSVAELRSEVEAYLATLTTYPTEQLVASYLRKLYEIEDVGDSYYSPQEQLNQLSPPGVTTGPIADGIDDPDKLLELTEHQENVQILLTPDAPLEIEQKAAPDAFSGRVGGIDLFDFLQMMLAARRQARLELYSQSNESAMLWVANGDIVHATCGDRQGAEAVFYCLAFAGGNFSVLPWLEPLEQTIDARGDYLLLEAARRMDEGSKGEAGQKSMSDSGAWDLSSLDLGPEEASAPGDGPGAGPETQAKRHAWDRLLEKIRGPEPEAPAQPEPAAESRRSGSPPAVAADQRAVQLLEEGLELIRAKDLTGAMAAWEQAAQLDPGNRSIQINLKRLRKQIKGQGD